MMLPAGKVRESPLATVLDAVNAPHHCRTGVPAESQISRPTTVAAGMPVKVMQVAGLSAPL